MKKLITITLLLMFGASAFAQIDIVKRKVTLDSLDGRSDTIWTSGEIIPQDSSEWNIGSVRKPYRNIYADSIFGVSTYAETKGLIFPFPDSFSYRPPFHVLRDADTTSYFIDPNFDLRDYARIEGTGTAYYVSVETGNDANPGTSAGSPLKSISAALAKSDVGTVYVAPGYYYDQYSWKGTVPTRSIEIIGTGDSVILTRDFRDVLTFVAEGNLYKAYTDTTPSVLWDRLATDQFGDPLTLGVYTSKAQVDTATTGAYYYASDTLYVRLSDFRAPDSFMSVFTPSFHIRLVGEGLKYYFKNIYSYGGGISSTNTDGSNGGVRIYIDSMTARGGDFTFDGNAEVILFNSSFAKVRNADLLNYDPQNGVIPVFVEYNCNVYNTMDRGYTPGGSDQASTGHNGCRGLRLNSSYKYTVGQCVADVNGCESWLVDCTADSSITVSSATYLFGTGSVFGRAWLQDCKSYNIPSGGYDVNSTGLQVVHVNNLTSTTYSYGTNGEIDSNYTYTLYDPIEFAMVDRMMSTKLVDLVPQGTTGQTLRYNGSTLTASSFLYNNGTSIGINTTSPSGIFNIVNNSGNANILVSTTVSGVQRSLTLTGTDGNWLIGTQNTVNSGSLIFHVGSLASSSALMTLSRTGNLSLGTTDVSTYKLNVNGNMRLASTNVSTNNTDSVAGFVGANQLINKIPRGVFMQNTDTVSSGNITFVNHVTHYSFSGTTATWTLPTLAAGDGATYFIKNRGSGNLTINSSGGGNDIYDTAATNTITVAAGASITLHNDGTYFVTY